MVRILIDTVLFDDDSFHDNMPALTELKKFAKADELSTENANRLVDCTQNAVAQILLWDPDLSEVKPYKNILVHAQSELKVARIAAAQLEDDQHRLVARSQPLSISGEDLLADAIRFAVLHELSKEELSDVSLSDDAWLLMFRAIKEKDHRWKAALVDKGVVWLCQKISDSEGQRKFLKNVFGHCVRPIDNQVSCRCLDIICSFITKLPLPLTPHQNNTRPKGRVKHEIRLAWVKEFLKITVNEDLPSMEAQVELA